MVSEVQLLVNEGDVSRAASSLSEERRPEAERAVFNAAAAGTWRWQVVTGGKW
jgi:hypothetical protein